MAHRSAGMDRAPNLRIDPYLLYFSGLYTMILPFSIFSPLLTRRKAWTMATIKKYVGKGKASWQVRVRGYPRKAGHLVASTS